MLNTLEDMEERRMSVRSLETLGLAKADIRHRDPEPEDTDAKLRTQRHCGWSGNSARRSESMLELLEITEYSRDCQKNTTHGSVTDACREDALVALLA